MAYYLSNVLNITMYHSGKTGNQVFVTISGIVGLKLPRNNHYIVDLQPIT